MQEAADRLGGHDAVGEDLVPARARHGGGTLAALLDAADDDSDTLAVLARTVLDLLDRED